MSPRLITVFGLPLVLLALAVQIAVGAIVLQPQMMELAQLSQTSPICHAGVTLGATPGDTTPAAPQHHSHCMFCPLCAAVATSGHVLASAGPPLPAPLAVVAYQRAGMPPPATAPPVAPPAAAQPRGPPTLLA